MHKLCVRHSICVFKSSFHSLLSSRQTVCVCVYLCVCMCVCNSIRQDKRDKKTKRKEGKSIFWSWGQWLATDELFESRSAHRTCSEFTRAHWCRQSSGVHICCCLLDLLPSFCVQANKRIMRHQHVRTLFLFQCVHRENSSLFNCKTAQFYCIYDRLVDAPILYILVGALQTCDHLLNHSSRCINPHVTIASLPFPSVVKLIYSMDYTDKKKRKGILASFPLVVVMIWDP